MREWIYSEKVNEAPLSTTLSLPHYIPLPRRVSLPTRAMRLVSLNATRSVTTCVGLALEAHRPAIERVGCLCAAGRGERHRTRAGLAGRAG